MASASLNLDRRDSVLFRIVDLDLKKLLISLVENHGKGSVRAGRMVGAHVAEVTFRSKEIANKIVEEGKWKVNDKEFEVRPVQAIGRTVFVKGLPTHVPDHVLGKYLEGYGKVASIGRIMFKEEILEDVETGTRRVRLEMKKSLPNIIRMGEFIAHFEYEGVVRLCRKCNGEDHLASECEAPTCYNCGSLDHKAGKCDKECKICGGRDHSVLTCERKTFAEALRLGKEGEKSDIVASLPLEKEPPETNSADTGNTNLTAESTQTTEEPSTMENKTDVETKNEKAPPKSENTEEDMETQTGTANKRKAESPLASEEDSESICSTSSLADPVEIENRNENLEQNVNPEVRETKPTIGVNQPVTENVLEKMKFLSTSSLSDCSEEPSWANRVEDFLTTTSNKPKKKKPMQKKDFILEKPKVVAEKTLHGVEEQKALSAKMVAELSAYEQEFAKFMNDLEDDKEIRDETFKINKGKVYRKIMAVVEKYGRLGLTDLSRAEGYKQRYK